MSEESKDTLAKVYSFSAFKKVQDRKREQTSYYLRLKQMDKAHLLQELIKYNDDFKNNPKDIDATIRGEYILSVLNERAELNELRTLANEFQRKLKLRLYEQMQNLK